jgi:hypothetical protein
MKRILHLPRVETSQFQRELWAAEAEHPVFAGSLLKLRLLASTAPNRRSKSKRPLAKATA